MASPLAFPEKDNVQSRFTAAFIGGRVRLLVVPAKGRVQLFDVASGTEVGHPVHDGIGVGPVSVEETPASQYFVYNASGRIVRVDAATGSIVAPAASVAPSAFFQQVSDNGDTILSEGEMLGRTGVEIWKRDSPSAAFALDRTVEMQPQDSTTMSPDGPYIARTTPDGVVHVTPSNSVVKTTLLSVRTIPTTST